MSSKITGRPLGAVLRPGEVRRWAAAARGYIREVVAPSGAKIARMASARVSVSRLGAAALFKLFARIQRASTASDRPWPAASTRRRANVSSPRSGITKVFAANHFHSAAANDVALAQKTFTAADCCPTHAPEQVEAWQPAIPIGEGVKMAVFAPHGGDRRRVFLHRCGATPGPNAVINGGQAEATSSTPTLGRKSPNVSRLLIQRHSI